MREDTLKPCHIWCFVWPGILQPAGEIQVGSWPCYVFCSVPRTLLTRIFNVMFVENIIFLLQVEDGSLDVGVLGKTIKIPVQTLSSNDTSSIDALLKNMGQKLGTMLKSANVPQQEITLHTVFTKRDGSTFAVDTPLGTTENVEDMLSKLTLWSLVPQEAHHQHIRHVSMRIQVVPARFTAILKVSTELVHHFA